MYKGGELTNNDILKLDQNSLTWTEVGRMQENRGWHTGSVIDINFNDYKKWCNVDGWTVRIVSSIHEVHI